jgi:hypothetical protein
MRNRGWGGAFWDVRFKPNCTSQVKLAESGWITNHYNECGYRSDDPCGLKGTETLRVAIIGASISWGYYVPFKDSFGAVLLGPKKSPDRSGISFISRRMTRLPKIRMSS